MAEDAGGAMRGAEGNPAELVGLLLFPEAMVVGKRTKSELRVVKGEVSTKGLLQRLPLLPTEDGLGTF